jgi:hypothetical protein
MSNSPHPCSSNLNGAFLKSLVSDLQSMFILRVGFSKDGCNLYVTLSMNVAGSSEPSGPTATSLMDHFRIGGRSCAGGRSVSIC